MAVEWAGQAAFVRFDAEGTVIAARLFGPGFVRASRVTLDGLDSWRGRIADFDDEHDTLDIIAGPAPSDGHPAGSVIYVRHKQGVSTFSLRCIEHIGGDRYRARLDHSPHVAVNRLEVNRMYEDRIVVEPPPNLPRSAGPADLLHLGLHVYSRGNGQHKWLGSLISCGGLRRHDGFGQGFSSPESTLAVAPTPRSLVPDEVLEVSRMHLGRDEVIVPEWVAYPVR